MPSVFRDAGYEVILMSELYPDGEDQGVGDDRWISDVSGLGLVALTKDVAIVRAHRGALEASRLQVFALSNANLTGPEMAERFRYHLNRIVHRSRKPGPFVDVLGPRRIERRWRP
ncbi:MAG: hypothetical protein JJU45_19315 [Acidimicrobiia bacterium]|nr:hypothetical protein [Acidimicrobiia bacterium]